MKEGIKDLVNFYLRGNKDSGLLLPTEKKFKDVNIENEKNI